MPDSSFESLLAGQLREYAEAGVRPIDRFAIAEGTIAVGRSDGLGARLRHLIPTGRRPYILVIVGLLVLALAMSVALVGSRLLTPRPALPPPHSYLNELVRASDLPTPMGRPVLVPLVDGGVLVIGSDYGNGGDPTITAYLYDPETGTSMRTGPMVPAEQPVGPAVRLRDGRVLLTGDGVPQIFDPVTLRFAMVGPMATARSGASVAVLRDGRVLIAGGMPPGGNPGADPALRSAELFDPDTLTFSLTGSMANSQGGGAMATLPDGRVLMATNPTAEVYDPSTGTFSAAGAMSGDGNPIVVPDGRVVLFGSTGLYSGGSITVWDPISGTFSASSLPEPLTGATLLDDGRVLLIGMCRGRQTGWTGLYDSTTGVTNPGPPTRACRPTSTRLADGRVLIVGGDINDDVRKALPTVEIFR